MSMSISYVSTGRTNQKARTRDALVAAARRWLAEGVTPSVEQAAERAGVSRATAYRYFDNQQLLIAAAAPFTEAASLLPDDPPQDPVERVAIVASELIRITIESETELRAMLRISLAPSTTDEELPLRKGRRLRWFDDALSPLRSQLGAKRYEQLVVSVSAACGIESLVWLTDVAGLTREEAAGVLVDMARSLTRAATADNDPRSG